MKDSLLQLINFFKSFAWLYVAILEEKKIRYGTAVLEEKLRRLEILNAGA
jgi:hypothetical protein